MSKEVITTYTPYQADRSQRLNQTVRTFRALENIFNHPKFKDDPGKTFKFFVPTQDYKMTMLEIDRQFAFGTWLCMRTLINDLAQDGCYDTAVDIVENTFGTDHREKDKVKPLL